MIATIAMRARISAYSRETLAFLVALQRSEERA